MGLDITAYRQLKPDLTAEVDDEGYPKDWHKHFQPGVSLGWSEKEWPGRCPELSEGTIYSHTESLDFRAGSYSGYNEWRSWLSRLAGFRDANDYWKRSTTAAPFYELIHFADNEGVIGAAAAAELAKDFAAYRPNVDHASDDQWAVQLFHIWQAACEMAADGGAINFH